LLEALNKIDYKIDVKRLREVAATFLWTGNADQPDKRSHSRNLRQEARQKKESPLVGRTFPANGSRSYGPVHLLGSPWESHPKALPIRTASVDKNAHFFSRESS